MPQTSPKRILSGMQPTNNLHIGNYLGALKNWVKLQEDTSFDCLYCVVDLHAITMPYDAAKLKQSTREIAAAYWAAGVDPKRSAIFAQSDVPQHPYLMWLLATITQMGKLNRMTQFKDKAGKDKEKAGLGLYAYPVLMAADILLYRATHVPVGEDQVQHIELTRDIAATFGHKFGEGVLVEPQVVLMPEGARIMSLQDGAKKMSKSDPSEKSRINMTDNADAIAQKIRKAKTDTGTMPSSKEETEGRPEALNLLAIYAALADEKMEDVMRAHGGKSFSQFKENLTELAVAKLSPLTAKMRELTSDPAEIDRVLKQGGEKARAIAEKTMADVQKAMGFWTVA